MPKWYFDKRELARSPSFVDGIDEETERRYRREGARFIIDMGNHMTLGYGTTTTGVVYFHRFYTLHSFRTFPRYVTACCCLFLAGKVEETPKKCKDIIRQAKLLLPDDKFATFGDDPKEEVMTLERILLQSIKFDLQVEHPHSFLFKYAKCLKGDKVKLEKMVQMACNFLNDSLSTTISLQWEPEIVAIALMFLAGKLSKFEVQDWMDRQPKHKNWWDMFVEDITTELLEDICHQVLDLYSPLDKDKPRAESPPPRPPPAKTQDPKKKSSAAATPPLSASPVAPIPVGSIKTTTTPMKMNGGVEKQQPPPPPMRPLLPFAPYAAPPYTARPPPPPPPQQSAYATPPPLLVPPGPPPPPLMSLPPRPPPLLVPSGPPPTYYPPPPPPQARPYYPPS